MYYLTGTVFLFDINHLAEIPYGPEVCSGPISTTSSIVFLAARISHIRFFTAVQIY